MAMGGIPRPAPAKSNSSASSRRRGIATAAHPRSSSTSTGNSTRDGTNPPGPIITQERHESNVQQQQPQQSPHAQQQQHFRHEQNRVGKRYRDKLTAGFESLQTTLGLEEVGDELETARGSGGEGGQEEARGDGLVATGSSANGAARRRRRPLNKARIIDLTCERVRELVGEWEAARAELEVMRRERVLQGW